MEQYFMQPNLADYQLYIFDWDGTLMDSIARIVSSMQAAAKLTELPIPTDNQVKSIIGLSLDVASQKLFPEITGSQQAQINKHYKQQFIHDNNTPVPMFSGAIDLLTKLKHQNKQLAVATGKGREGLDRVLAISKTLTYFDETICADEAKSKPDPQMLTKLLERFNISASQAVMIGDSIHDMALAKNAGVDSIGITLGVDNEKALNAYQPVAVVDSLEQLSNLVLQQPSEIIQ